MSLIRGRRRTAALVAIVVVAGGGGAWALTRSSTTPTTAAATFSLVAATTGTMSQTVITTGTIAPAQQSTLTFTGSGSVTSVTAAVGLKVAKGAALASIDPTTASTAVTTATAAVTAAGQQVTAVAAGTAVQIAAAAAQLALAQLQLVRAQEALAATTLTAPFAGVVATVGFAVGDVIGTSSGSAGAGASSASSAGITLITTDSWLVNASVGSADLAQLRKGMQAQITPTGASTMVFGTVSSIGIVASATTGGSATFPVVIAVTGSPAGLYSGGSAAVSLIVQQTPDVLTIPSQALHTTNGATTVYQQVNGKQVITPVTVGTSYGPTTQILTGLVTGDKVEVTARGGYGGTRRSSTGSTTGGTQRQNNGPPAGYTGSNG